MIRRGDAILAVLGAINVDLVVSGAPLPAAGQTVTGGTFARHQGGKGGNQAVAAARVLGERGEVALIAAVGNDDLGVKAIDALRADGVRTDQVVTRPDVPTGVAMIAVGPDGENQISVALGANGTLDPAEVKAALETLRPRALLASLEVPEPAVRAALEWCGDHSIPSVLNPAPAHPWVRNVAMLATYVTPNEHERGRLGDLPGVILIETKGDRGATIHRNGGRADVPAPSAVVVDTTGAGDCFNGVLAAGLVRDLELVDAVRDGVVAATLSVGMAGAREGMPDEHALAAARARL